MTKKHYKIQSQESYWIEALSLFTDGCLNEDEIKQYKKDLSRRLADLVKDNIVLGDVSKQSELLKAFIDFYNYRNTGDKTINNDEIEIFIDNL